MSPQPETSPPNAVNVLLITADIQQANLLASKLRAASAVVHMAHSAKDAIRQGGDLEQRLDLVLTDFDLPDTDGTGVIKRFRQLQDVPVAVFSTAANLDQAIQAFRAGAIDFLPESSGDEDYQKLVKRVAHIHAKQVELITSAEAGGGVNEAVTMAMPSDPSLVPVVTRRLSHWYAPACLHHRVSTRPINLALMEALMNAVVHGNLGVGSERKNADDWDGYQEQIQQRMNDPECGSRVVRVRANLVGDCLSLVVSDEGDGFSPETVPDLDELDVFSASGRGIAMIRQTMDSVHWTPRGNEITMQKLLRSDAVPLRASA